MRDTKPAELCVVWKQADGTEAVQTGIYVFDNMTIKDIRKLMECYSERGEELPYKVEFRVKEEEE